MHVGMVGYEGEKMSKSLGNLVLVSNELKRFSPDAFRLYLFSHHYRLPWEYIDGEIVGWQGIASDLAMSTRLASDTRNEELDPAPYREKFFAALDEDLYTPMAIEALVSLGDEIRQSSDSKNITAAQQALLEMGSILGLTFAA
jgi:L-cysteine:1D-myo-inositol 2-amino-2-deoxy-alpha-D-glucopyranoside ligase